MHLRIAALLGILVAFVVAPNAAADKPLKIPVVIEPFMLTGVCDFPVLLEAVGPQNQKIITFSDGQIVNGQLTVRATNLDEPSKIWQGTASGAALLRPAAGWVARGQGNGRQPLVLLPREPRRRGAGSAVPRQGPLDRGDRSERRGGHRLVRPPRLHREPLRDAGLSGVTAVPGARRA
jgi:hypothetical protein